MSNTLRDYFIEANRYLEKRLESSSIVRISTELKAKELMRYVINAELYYHYLNDDEIPTLKSTIRKIRSVLRILRTIFDKVDTCKRCGGKCCRIDMVPDYRWEQSLFVLRFLDRLDIPVYPNSPCPFLGKDGCAITPEDLRPPVCVGYLCNKLEREIRSKLGSDMISTIGWCRNQLFFKLISSVSSYSISSIMAIIEKRFPYIEYEIKDDLWYWYHNKY